MNQKLYKNKEKKLLCGVCSGIADYVGVTPTPIRLFFLLYSLACGLGIIVYIFAFFAIPNKPKNTLHEQ